MEIKLNKSAYLQGTKYKEGDTLDVNDNLAGAWIQTGVANAISCDSEFRPHGRKSFDDTRGEDHGIKEISKTDDG